jgi:bacteriorhodopsin
MARVGTGTTTGFFAGPYLELTVALLAFATIALSYFAVAGFGVTITVELDGPAYLAFVFTYIGSLGAMGATLGIVYALAGQTGTDNLANILSFSIPWSGYAVVYLVQANGGIADHVCDVLYTVLDVYSKAVFGLVTLFNLF